MTSQEILELINRRRRQVMVHAVLYEIFDTSLISDATYDKWSKQCYNLQQTYPDIAKQAVFADEFKDYLGETGVYFVNNLWAMQKTQQLLFLRDNGTWKNTDL